MRRGTTPSHYFKTPIDLTGATIYITYAQNEQVVLEKTGNDLVVTPEGVSCQLSQADTLSFKPNDGRVYVQLRYVLEDGTADASQIFKVGVMNILKNEEIKWTSE